MREIVHSSRNIPEMSAQQFFRECAPGASALVKLEAGTPAVSGGVATYPVRLPTIILECPACGGDRVYSASQMALSKAPSNKFIEYRCRNCGTSTVTYAVALIWPTSDVPAQLTKIGQSPPFGPTLPSRLVSLLGPDRELLVKGRRAESQGLGIAAFAYYRRVVENQRARIFESIIKACKRLGVDGGLVAELESAKLAHRFADSVAQIKRALPESLLIERHNPLLLLHSAVSEGLHNHSDEECLAYAANVRTVLAALVQRLDAAIDENQELLSAVQALLPRGNDAAS